MLTDPLFDLLVRQLRFSEPQQLGGPGTRPKNRLTRSGIFNKEAISSVSLPVPTDLMREVQITQYFAIGKSVLKHIQQYIDLGATIDSSARIPLPSCHPKTRSKIGDRLFSWLVNHKRQWNIMWLHGPAGTGRSTVAQTFAKRCVKKGRLGASFFFSQSNDRNNSDTVIPSLIYQLALCLPHYRTLVTAQLADDPELLWKARRTQFKKLIVEPLSELQGHGQKRIREPLLVVLDGLNECKEVDAQWDIIEMINEVVRLKHDFPLVWLICSGPEPHIKYLFSRADFTVNCDREELVIDAESIAGVSLYLRNGLVGIKDHFGVTIPTWPSEEQLENLSLKASGNLAFASTALRYIGDPTFENPMYRLVTLLHSLPRVGPSDAIDTLYTLIFSHVPDEVLPIIKRILGFHFHIHTLDDGSSYNIQTLCNFFYIDRATFYHAFRGLYSIIDVPSPEDASDQPLYIDHASVKDYLIDRLRSGSFAISSEEFWLAFAKQCLSWYKIDLALFHMIDGSAFDVSHSHGILPGLTWVSDDNRARISHRVANLAEDWCWTTCGRLSEWDEALRSQIQHFDFRCIRKDDLNTSWYTFVTNLWERDSASDVIRTTPLNEVDLHLLELMKSMVQPVLRCRPATFPLHLDGGQYFLLGRDSEAIVCWTTGRRERHCFGALNLKETLLPARIDTYQAWLQVVEKEDEGGLVNIRDSIYEALQSLRVKCGYGVEPLPPVQQPPLGYHPETRKNIREKIAAWLNDTQRDWTVLWLTGPPGVGKTTVAQIVAEDYQRIGRLGAAVSTPEVGDFNQVIWTLLYQFAIRHPKYGELIAQKLVADPEIFMVGEASDKLETLFTESLLHLKNKDNNFLRSPLLFILDMEEGNISNYLGRLTSYFTTLSLKGPFRFLLVIRSRYEGYHEWKEEIGNTEALSEREERLTFDDIDAQRDVRHVLYDGFAGISRLFPDLFPPGGEPWPSRGKLDLVSRITSGFFPFAFSVLDFVGNLEFRDPVTRLNTCIDLIQNPGNVEETHPLYPLFLFYDDVVKSYSLLDLSFVRFYLRFPGNKFTTQDLANFLNLDQREFYRDTMPLASIFHVPGPSEAPSRSPWPYHSSLNTYLLQLDSMEGGERLTTKLIRWYSTCLLHRCELKECEAWPAPAWQYHDPEQYLSFVTKVKELMWQVDLWAECAALSSLRHHLSRVPVIDELGAFKFCHLKQIDVRPGCQFRKFLAWLLIWGSDLIRYGPSSGTDELLAKKYNGPWLKLPLDHLGEYYIVSLHHTEPVPPRIEFISTHAKQNQYVRRVDKGMCWLGLGERACLVIAYEERITASLPPVQLLEGI